MSGFKEVEMPKRVADATDQATKMVQRVVGLQPLDTTVQSAVNAGNAAANYGISVPRSLKLISAAKIAQAAARSQLFTDENRAVVLRAAAELKSHAEKALETGGREAQDNQQLALGIAASLQQYIKCSAEKKAEARYFSDAMKSFEKGDLAAGKKRLGDGFSALQTAEQKAQQQSAIANATGIHNLAARMKGDRMRRVLGNEPTLKKSDDDPLIKVYDRVVKESEAIIAQLRSSKAFDPRAQEQYETRAVSWTLALSCLVRASEGEDFVEQAKASQRFSGAESREAAGRFEASSADFRRLSEQILSAGQKMGKIRFQDFITSSITEVFRRRADVISDSEGFERDDPMRESLRAITSVQRNALLSMAFHQEFSRGMFEAAERNYSRAVTALFSVTDPSTCRDIYSASITSFSYARRLNTATGQERSDLIVLNRNLNEDLDKKIYRDMKAAEAYNTLKTTANLGISMFIPIYGLGIAAYGIHETYAATGRVAVTDVALIGAGAIPGLGIGAKLAKAGAGGAKAVKIAETAVGFSGLAAGTILGGIDAYSAFKAGQSIDGIVGAFSTLYPVGHIGVSALARRRPSSRAPKAIPATKTDTETERTRFYRENRREILRAVPEMGGANLEDRTMEYYLAKAKAKKPENRTQAEARLIALEERRAKATGPSEKAAAVPQELAGKVDQESFNAFMERRGLGPEAAAKAGNAYAKGGIPALLRELGVRAEGPEWADLPSRMEDLTDILFNARDRQGRRMDLLSVLDAEYPGSKIASIELSKGGARGGAWRCDFIDASGQERHVYLKTEDMSADVLSHDVHSARAFPTPAVTNMEFTRADGSTAHYGIMEPFATGMKGSDGRIGTYAFEHACPIIDIMDNKAIRGALEKPGGLKEFGEELGRFLRFEHQTGAADFNQENVFVGIVKAQDGSAHFRVGRIDMGDIFSYHENTKTKALEPIMGGYLNTMRNSIASPVRLDEFKGHVLEGWVAEGQELQADSVAIAKIRSAVAANEASGTKIGHVQRKSINASGTLEAFEGSMISSRSKLEGEFETALPATLWDEERRIMERQEQRKQRKTR